LSSPLNFTQYAVLPHDIEIVLRPQITHVISPYVYNRKQLNQVIIYHLVITAAMLFQAVISVIWKRVSQCGRRLKFFCSASADV